ncbi:MAG: UDP-N-acetylglucosamine 2-epimerase (non-hydrolyzing) [Flavobacteriales bacterium]|nr:UDP-N-acetylglucosamine 2-epimerase (non-hydrolyzing) [Flavobacteriales bacterium]
MIPKKIVVVVGTRPNFIKVTQLEKEFKKSTQAFEYILIHTGQHFDNKMSSVFFEQLQLKSPDYNLAVKETDRQKKIVEMQNGIKEVLIKEKPELLIVVGDVDSTYSAAMAAKELNIKIAHLESGLRSFDNRMPEEINRIAVDKISDHFFITEKSGEENLLKDGVASEKMHFVGNTMIDTLVAFDQKIKEDKVLQTLNIQPGEYALMTMHRPQNVDNKESLELILNLISKITEKLKLVIPIHPRTRKQIEYFELQSIIDNNDRIIELEPIDYFAFQNLILNAKLVITDSGGIQEETTFRKVPCLTIRDNTERPSTIDLGSNELMELNENAILSRIESILSDNTEESSIPPLWDGKATQRIVEVLEKLHFASS